MLFLASTTNAAPGVNQTISFQGRLMTPQGQPVPEGYYNIQFKIYQDGNGTAAGNPGGTLEWTETRVNNGGNNGVYVKNGYFSVDLGSQNPFGSQVDWNQDTLWLSMNIAGSSALCETFGTAPCLADGEMVPMKRLTAAPYALNSGKVGGKGVDELIHNSTSQQTGNFNISGTGIANILQGTSTVLAPNLDRATSGTLSIGSTNASSISMGAGDRNVAINIASEGAGNKTVTMGSTYGTSNTVIQGGTNGVNITSTGDVTIGAAGGGSFNLHNFGDATLQVGDASEFNVNNSDGSVILAVKDDMNIITAWNTNLDVQGTAQFRNGLNIQGETTYTTPGGYNMKSAIGIANYQVGQYASIFAFGLPANSDATARGMLVADARTGVHQATIGVLSTDESNILGFSYHGSNSKGYVTNTGNTIALQGNGVDLLTATNASGQARVGIGNDASSGYSLDVTGSTNVSGNYAINGVSVLNNAGLNFTAASDASVNAASGQALRLTGDGGVKIGDSTASGDPTLLTLDKGAGAPSATGDAVLGSMYYDTTLGRVQCYEADGWGSCSSSPDNFVNLNPEYSNAVTSGSTNGTFESAFCSDDLNINGSESTEVCSTDETYNYYSWTSTGDQESKDIFVTYQLPSNFTSFVSGSTSLMGKVNDDVMANVSYRVYKSTPTGLVACGTGPVAASAVSGEWNKGIATGSADPANCGFSANDSLVIKISLTSSDTLSDPAYAYASTLSFAFSQ